MAKKKNKNPAVAPNNNEAEVQMANLTMELREQMNQLRSELSSMAADHEILRSELSSMAADHEILRSELSSMAADNEILRSELSSMAADHEIVYATNSEVFKLVLSSSISDAATKTAEMMLKKEESAIFDLNAAEMRLLAVAREKDGVERDLDEKRKELEDLERSFRTLEQANAKNKGSKWNWLFPAATTAIFVAVSLAYAARARR